MQLVRHIHPLLTAFSIAACVASCGDDVVEGADSGSGSSESGGTTTSSTTATTLSTSSASTSATTSVDDSSSSTSDTDTDTDTTGPYPLAPGDDSAASTDIYDVEATEGTTTTIDFTWYETAGWPAATDLSVHVAGDRDPLVQVFTVGSAPFVRIGLELVPIEASTKYTIAVTLGKDHTATTIVHLGRDVIVEQTRELPKDLEISGLELVRPSANMLAAPVGLGDIAVE